MLKDPLSDVKNKLQLILDAINNIEKTYNTEKIKKYNVKISDLLNNLTDIEFYVKDLHYSIKE